MNVVCVRFYFWRAVTVSTLLATGSCGAQAGPHGPAGDASGNTGDDAGGAPDTASTMRPDAAHADASLPPTNVDASPADFDTRCGAPGVVMCNGFDTSSDIAGTYGSPRGTLPSSGDGMSPTIDTTQSASGTGSLLFTIPAQAGADQDGSFFTNFSPDLSVQFADNSDFYVQWRQRFDPHFLTDQYSGGEGWKQAIIGTGDRPGCTPSTSAGGDCSSSCSAPEVVPLNSYHRGFLEAYNSCTGSTSHGPYDPFEEPFGSEDFKLQNAMPSPYCLYSQGHTTPPSFFPPAGDCMAYFPNEWMTFQVHIHVGAFVTDEYQNSHVDIWIARQGLASVEVLDWGPYALSAGTDHETYGKIWLLPYDTGRDSSIAYTQTFTWYDELIVSRQRIADPAQ
jgi:hypothetical protein